MKNNQVEIKTPQLAESIEQALVLTWKHSIGDFVAEGAILVELETDKVVLEVTAPITGVIEKITTKEGAEVKSGEVMGLMTEKQAPEQKADSPSEKSNKENQTRAGIVTPSARKEAIKQDVSEPENIKGSGKKGRVIKQDVQSSASIIDQTKELKNTKSTQAENSQPQSTSERSENIVPISRLRARVAERLLQSQQQTATLTTFNDADMKAVIDLRKNYQDQFIEKYGVKLGFMSFFTLASVIALERFPSVNAYLQDQKIVYHQYCDIGIAMSTERGLLVPILRNTEKMNFADVEKEIINFAQKAKHNKIEIGDLQGGTFSITNGGIFGSLLSTPILNPPQSAILGLHAINPTPVAINGEIVIRPMMKLALSYDHRIVDGREAVSFLVVVKQMIENPSRMLLGV